MRQRIILAALCFLLTVLNIKAGESAYYYVGVPNVGDPWSGTLPVLFIDTESEVNSKEVYVKGKYYIDALGLEGYQSLGTKENPLPLQIKGRGNWTWTGFNKKPYRLKFDLKASPLGMKSNKHFNLLANADDHNAFLNNTVGFQLSRLLKLAYTPEQRPVEVVLNGDYIGLYMLTDKIRVEKNRVNIVEQSDEETDPQNVTGGWLLEIDNYDEENQIRMTESNGYTLRFTYHTPEVLSDVQKNYITDFLKATDRAIYNTDKTSTEWEQYIDIDALARFYIVQEVMGDGESFHGDNYPQLDGFIDDFILQISDAAANDGRRWPEYSQSNINDRKNNFKNKISQKVNYLRQQWGNGISSIWAVPDDEADDDCWYGLDGRKINGVPTRHGLFIHKGRKVVL